MELTFKMPYFTLKDIASYKVKNAPRDTQNAQVEECH